MDSEPSAPRSSFRSVLVAVSVCIMILLAATGLRGYRDLALARQQEASLEGRIEATRERIVGLENRIRRLRSDPAMLERLAREELKMARPGDVVILLAGEPATAPAQP